MNETDRTKEIKAREATVFCCSLSVLENKKKGYPAALASKKVKAQSRGLGGMQC